MRKKWTLGTWQEPWGRSCVAPREGAGRKSRDQGPGVHGRDGEVRSGGRAGSHLGEDVSCVGGSRGQGREEGGLARRLDGMDHPQLRVFQVGGLAVGVDEHKDVVHAYGRESRASRAQDHSAVSMVRPNLGQEPKPHPPCSLLPTTAATRTRPFPPNLSPLPTFPTILNLHPE